jgi:hypothetical protein
LHTVRHAFFLLSLLLCRDDADQYRPNHAAVFELVGGGVIVFAGDQREPVIFLGLEKRVHIGRGEQTVALALRAIKRLAGSLKHSLWHGNLPRSGKWCENLPPDGTGVSSAVNVYGHELNRVDSFKENGNGFAGVQRVEMSIGSVNTLYPSVGDALGNVTLVSLVGLLIGLWVTRNGR